MDPQEVTKIIKAALIVAGMGGVQVSPEHQQIIIEGGLAFYAALALLESWLKRRRRKATDKETP